MPQLLSLQLADTILTRYPDPDSIPYRPWCYVQGYVLMGFEKLWRSTRQEKYLAYLRQFVDQHVRTDGSLSGFSGESLDDIMAGTTVAALYQITREEKYRLAAQKIRSAFDDYPRNSDGGFWHSRSLPHEMWIDGVFMGQMFLTRYAAAVGDAPACFAEALRQITLLAGHCRKGASGLFLHAYDEARHATWADPASGLSSEVWSEGLGWYALILVETCDLMPVDYPGRSEIAALIRELAQGLCQTQDERTGLWCQVVDKGSQPDNWHDTSGSAMFVYMIQKALDLNLLDPALYTPCVERGFAGLRTKAVVGPDGLIDILDACDGVCVQDNYAAYVNYPRVINAKEAVGGVLWAALAVEKPGQ